MHQVMRTSSLADNWRGAAVADVREVTPSKFRELFEISTISTSNSFLASHFVSFHKIIEKGREKEVFTMNMIPLTSRSQLNQGHPTDCFGRISVRKTCNRLKFSVREMSSRAFLIKIN